MLKEAGHLTRSFSAGWWNYARGHPLSSVDSFLVQPSECFLPLGIDTVLDLRANPIDVGLDPLLGLVANPIKRWMIEDPNRVEWPASCWAIVSIRCHTKTLWHRGSSAIHLI
ncbi:hypothetical protein [Nonomuraea longicatena]|uniref:hypothetical protein n=1 Tax=Nonomuraea longicatena TaxID=83682 RepID=UPI0031D1774E